MAVDYGSVVALPGGIVLRDMGIAFGAFVQPHDKRADAESVQGDYQVNEHWVNYA